MPRWLFVLPILFVQNPAEACSKFFQPLNVPGAAIENAVLKFSENEFGPELRGLDFTIGKDKAVGLFFGGRQKRWCAVLKDKKEGTSLDCEFFYRAKAGTEGGAKIVVSASTEASAGSVAHAVHKGDDEILVRSPDGTQPELLIKGRIAVTPESMATATLDLVVWDPVAQKELGMATHSVQGAYIIKSAQIKRPQVRTKGPPPPIKPLTTVSLIGASYTGPARCGFGDVSKFTAPKEERVPARSM